MSTIEITSEEFRAEPGKWLRVVEDGKTQVVVDRGDGRRMTLSSPRLEPDPRIRALEAERDQLKARVAELEAELGAARQPFPPHMVEVLSSAAATDAYERGRADERADVVRWMRLEDKPTDIVAEQLREERDNCDVVLCSIADCLERGEHVRKGGA